MKRHWHLWHWARNINILSYSPPFSPVLTYFILLKTIIQASLCLVADIWHFWNYRKVVHIVSIAVYIKLCLGTKVECYQDESKSFPWICIECCNQIISDLKIIGHIIPILAIGLSLKRNHAVTTWSGSHPADHGRPDWTVSRQLRVVTSDY